MNAAVLIASRDLRDRSRLFLIAAAMAVIPFASALAVRQNRQVAIATVACFLAAAYTGALAVALGVSAIGRELTEKRLSFFFAKPVSAASIWIGKAAAGIVTWLGAFAIIVLPAYLLANDGWREYWTAGGSGITVYTLISSAVLFFGSHAASTMLRSRSALVAVDFALLALMLVAIFAMTRPILLGGGLDVVLTMLLVIGVAMMLILIVAPVWQLARGRIDPRRNHASFSTVLWSGAAVVVLIAAGFAWWVISPPLAGIVPYTVEQSPSGRWIAISGDSPNRGSYVASFLVDSTSGHRERVATPWGNSRISNDGRTMVWLESDELWPRKGTMRVHTRALEAGSKPQATTLTIGNPWESRLSDDGSRLAVIAGDKLEVYETGTGRLLGAATGATKGARWSKLFFAGPNAVRIIQSYRAGTERYRILELDLTQRKLSTTADWPSRLSRLPNSHFSVNVTRDGSRIFIREEGAVHDARTGAVLMTLPTQPRGPFFSAMLRDGTTIVTRDSKLYQFDASGALIREMPIPVPQAGVAGQVGASKILLSRSGRSEWQLLLVDLATGKVDAALPGCVSALGWNETMVPQFTDDATIVAMDGTRELVLWDLKSGTKRPFPS
ncbi:MAG: ABC transporter permease [Acidobacteriota bacterium]|nr:ABC transporter permease [Acidobacteriota bacterium]